MCSVSEKTAILQYSSTSIFVHEIDHFSNESVTKFIGHIWKHGIISLPFLNFDFSLLISYGHLPGIFNSELEKKKISKYTVCVQYGIIKCMHPRMKQTKKKHTHSTTKWNETKNVYTIHASWVQSVRDRAGIERKKNEVKSVAKKSKISLYPENKMFQQHAQFHLNQRQIEKEKNATDSKTYSRAHSPNVHLVYTYIYIFRICSECRFYFSFYRSASFFFFHTSFLLVF